MFERENRRSIWDFTLFLANQSQLENSWQEWTAKISKMQIKSQQSDPQEKVKQNAYQPGSSKTNIVRKSSSTIDTTITMNSINPINDWYG